MDLTDVSYQEQRSLNNDLEEAVKKCIEIGEKNNIWVLRSWFYEFSEFEFLFGPDNIRFLQRYNSDGALLKAMICRAIAIGAYVTWMRFGVANRDLTFHFSTEDTENMSETVAASDMTQLALKSFGYSQNSYNRDVLNDFCTNAALLYEKKYPSGLNFDFYRHMEVKAYVTLMINIGAAVVMNRLKASPVVYLSKSEIAYQRGTPSYIYVPDNHRLQNIRFPLSFQDCSSLLPFNRRIVSGYYHTVGLNGDGRVLAWGLNSYGELNVDYWDSITEVAIGDGHTVGLRSDGTVVATGNDYLGACRTADWCDIVSIAAYGEHTIGLKRNGTVVYTGIDHYFEPLKEWTGIIAVSTSLNDTVGLRCDGTVLSAGKYGTEQTAHWSDIVAIYTDSDHVIGLKSDGRVIVSGLAHDISGLEDIKYNVDDWENIVMLANERHHLVGLKTDGSVVADGGNWYGACDVGGWRGIVSVAAGRYHTLGLKRDGTVVATGRNNRGQCEVSEWHNIVAIFAGLELSIGLESDGTLRFAGNADGGKMFNAGCNLFGKQDYEMMKKR